MKHYKNITIIGTSHIANESIQKVISLVHTTKPMVVALELDRKRLLSLLEKHSNKNIKEKGPSFKEIRMIGFKGYAFSLIGSYVERKLGSKVGTFPGDEMLSGYFAAKEVDARVALIDQDITITLQRFSKKITWTEKWRFISDIFKGIFFAKSQMKKMGISPSDVDLNKVPSQKMINKMILYVKDRYPNVYLVLIEERNKHIAEQLLKLRQLNQTQPIIAVLGAGHVDDVIKLLEEKDTSTNYSFSIG